VRRRVPLGCWDDSAVSAHPEQADLENLIEALDAGGVEFIVVGGAACVLHGAPVTTQDVDIVHRIDEENVDRLMAVLGGLQARVRDPAGRDIAPSRPALLGIGQIQLTTNLGPLDILCRLHDGRDYSALSPHVVEMTDGTLRLRVLDLPTLVEVKSNTGRARDRMVVPVLLALLRREHDPG
jgi:hypothetical protein